MFVWLHGSISYASHDVGAEVTTTTNMPTIATSNVSNFEENLYAALKALNQIHTTPIFIFNLYVNTYIQMYLKGVLVANLLLLDKDELEIWIQ